MKVSVKVDGGKELAAALRQYSKRLSNKVQREVLGASAEPMRSSIARYAPRDPGAPDLADNIVVSRATSKDAGSKTAVSVNVGPSRGFFYGYFQEWGTSRHGAQPFMRPGFDQHAQSTIADIGKRLWAEISRRLPTGQLPRRGRR